jgi:transcriptional regulator GlxA family with amidase domain
MVDNRIDRRELLAGGAAAAGVLAFAAASPLRAADDKPIPVAVLIDKDATVIDFTGPWEVFQDAGVAGNAGFELFTVAPQRTPLRVSAGLQIVPDYTLDNAPPAKVIVIPAQSGSLRPAERPLKEDWLKARFPETEIIMSVCTGAYLLARTGLLDGMSATTHHDYLADFARTFPKVNVVETRRYVDNGRLVTTAGLSSGIEGALRVVERYYGVEAARKVASYMEYVPTPWHAA